MVAPVLSVRFTPTRNFIRGGLPWMSSFRPASGG